MSRSPATLVGADTLLAGDLGSAGAVAKVDDIPDAMPMTSATSSITLRGRKPAVVETFSDGLQCVIWAMRSTCQRQMSAAM